MTKYGVDEVVLEYGPQGNVDAGRNCAIYELEDRYLKICDRLEKAEAENFKEELDEADIIYPETDFYVEEVPFYGIGEVLVAEQEKTEPVLGSLTDEPDSYVNEVRSLGLKAAANDLKLDLSLDNLCIENGELGILDINDPESIWTEEHLALHLMGTHLLNSIRKLETTRDFYAPEMKEMAENWQDAA